MWRLTVQIYLKLAPARKAPATHARDHRPSGGFLGPRTMGSSLWLGCRCDLSHCRCSAFTLNTCT